MVGKKRRSADFRGSRARRATARSRDRRRRERCGCVARPAAPRSRSPWRRSTRPGSRALDDHGRQAQASNSSSSIWRGLPCQGPPESEHLLLATRQQPDPAILEFGELRKVFVTDARRRGARRTMAQSEMFGNGEAEEHARDPLARGRSRASHRRAVSGLAMSSPSRRIMPAIGSGGPTPPAVWSSCRRRSDRAVPPPLRHRREDRGCARPPPRHNRRSARGELEHGALVAHR